MGKYLVKRLLQGVVSIIIVVGIVMVMIYSLLDRRMIFAQDPVWSKQQANQKTTYMYQKWENYGYLDYIPYGEYLQGLLRSGEITEEVRAEAASIGRTADKDSEIAAKYVEQFTQYYRSQGYTVERLDAVMTGRKLAKGGQQVIFAHKDHPLTHRLWNYLTGLVQVDNIHKVEEDVGERGITFTWHDPVYDDGRLSPAIIGNGTMHKYLFYMDDQFPFFHQNIASIHLGASYTVNTGIDVFTTMTKTQGSYVLSPMTPRDCRRRARMTCTPPPIRRAPGRITQSTPTVSRTTTPMWRPSSGACPRWGTLSSSASYRWLWPILWVCLSVS